MRNMCTRQSLILLSLFITVALSDDRKCDPPQDKPVNESFVRLCEPKWAIYHFFSAATDAPIARAMRTLPETVPALKKILSYFKEQADIVFLKIRRNHTAFEELKDMPCNIPDGEFKGARFESVKHTFSSYGWGLMKKDCATELPIKFEDTPVKEMRSYLNAMKKVARRAVLNGNKSNWTKPSTFSNFSYKSSTEHCRLLHFVAFRVNGSWALNTAFTNDDPTIYLAEGKRWYLVEILGLKGNQIVPVPLYLRRFPQREGEWVPNTTTKQAIWGGAPATSIFKDVFNAANNPAVRAAIATGANIREQVEDATTLSNIGIIVLPIVLATVPIASFSEVDTFGLLVYIIITDIMSALPLAIKGVELMKFGDSNFNATRTWMYGGYDKSDLATAESWYAECDASSWVVILGRVFLSISILAMVLGIILELVARKMFAKRRMMLNEKLHADWEVKAGHLWSKVDCNECPCSNNNLHFS